jgi:ABC-2 type transport system permease protein
VTGFWPLFKRELWAYFVTPLGWIALTVFLLLQGWHFALVIDHVAALSAQAASTGDVHGDVSLVSGFFGSTVFLYLILFLLIPPLTMRTFAEERRQGTVDLLLTSPVTNAAMVCAKYGGALAVYVSWWVPTLLYLGIAAQMTPIDWRVVGACYVGVAMVGAAYIALGVLASALSRNVFSALIFTVLIVLGLFLFGAVEFVTAEGTRMHALARYVSVWSHMSELAVGLIDSRRVVFYGSLIVWSMFLTTHAVRGWRHQ